MDRETCKECEKAFIKEVWWQDIDDFLESTSIWELQDKQICVKCFVRISNRYL